MPRQPPEDGQVGSTRELGSGDVTFDPSRILFQGNGVLVVHKPAGTPVHRGTDHPLGFAEMIDEWVRMNPGVIEIRPGTPVRPVHRLDRETSGVLALALQAEAARRLQAAFEGQEVRKEYRAVVAGPVEAIGHIKGRSSQRGRGPARWVKTELEFRRLRGDERLSLVAVVPAGGRTHQIRALFAQAGRPLAGDLRYGRPKPARQFLEKFRVPFFLLHAWRLTLPESILGAARTFEAPIPAEIHTIVAEKGWKPLD